VRQKTRSFRLSRRAFLVLGSSAALTSRPAAAQIGVASPLAKLGVMALPLFEDLERWTEKNGGELHAALVDATNGVELCGIKSAVVENPASNQKLITAAAALHYLGPGFTYRSGLFGTLTNGSVPKLVLRGEGDPSLSSSALEAMVEALLSRGVRTVGEILVDQSAFDDQFVPPAFEQQPGEWSAFRAPISAVAVDGNATTFCVEATKKGEPARVWFEPRGFVEIDGSVVTVGADKNAPRDPRRGRDYPGLTLKGKGDRLVAKVAGAIPERGEKVRWRKRVDDPRSYAGYVLKNLLEERGVTVRGGVALGGANEQRELASHRSAPLSELLHELGKKSDNFYSEMILKTLGMKLGGRPGKSATGAEALTAFLQQMGAWEDGTLQSNGSGLYDANRVSPRSLTRVLWHTLANPKLGPDFLNQLAVGGVDGTLKGRFHSLRDQRSVLAKTGTLRSVVSLSGYVFGPDRSSPLAFSFIVSGVAGRQPEVRKRIDKIVESLATELWKAPQSKSASR
jgi:D-alanyl-D-alanine carboxypeptidase/D-alanyl-D-alanine-endopeptidase (penicillin-binding protein 4)